MLQDILVSAKKYIYLWIHFYLIECATVLLTPKLLIFYWLQKMFGISHMEKQTIFLASKREEKNGRFNEFLCKTVPWIIFNISWIYFNETFDKTTNNRTIVLPSTFHSELVGPVSHHRYPVVQSIRPNNQNKFS